MALLHVRIEDDLKNEVSTILDDLGLDMSTVIRMFFKRIAKDNGISCIAASESKIKYVNFDDESLQFILQKRTKTAHPEAKVAGFWMDNIGLSYEEICPSFSVPVTLGMFHGESTVIFNDCFCLTYRAIFDIDDEPDFYHDWFGNNTQYSTDMFDITDKPKYEVITSEVEEAKYREILRKQIQEQNKQSDLFNVEAQLSEHLNLVKGDQLDVHIMSDKDEKIQIPEMKDSLNILSPNVIVLGSAGSGKSRHFVLPNMLSGDSSFIAVDGKGEYYEYCKDVLEEKGYDVQLLDLLSFAGVKYNPFDYIKSEYDLIQFAELIVKARSGDPSLTKTLKQGLLSSILVFVYRTYPKEEQALRIVTDVLSGFAYGDKKTRETLTHKIDSFMTETMVGTPVFSLWQNYKQSDDSAKAAVFEELDYDIKHRFNPVLEMTDYSTINISDLGKKKTAIFIKISNCDTSLLYLCSMFIRQTAFELIASANRDFGGVLKVPVKFYLDEFGNLDLDSSFISHIKMMNERNISITGIVQNIIQWKNIMGGPTNWLNLFNVLIYLGCNEMQTIDFFTSLLKAENTVVGSVNKKSKFTRMTLDSNDLAHLDNHKALIFMRDNQSGITVCCLDDKAELSPEMIDKLSGK